MLAAKKFDPEKAADAARTEGPEKQRFQDGVKADYDKGCYPAIQANMSLPKLEEIIALIRRRKAVSTLQRAPMRLGGRHVMENLDPRNMSLARRQAAAGGEGTHGHDIHGLRRARLGWPQLRKDFSIKSWNSSLIYLGRRGA